MNNSIFKLFEYDNHKHMDLDEIKIKDQVQRMLSDYQNMIWFAALSFVKNYELADEVAEDVQNRVLSEPINELAIKHFDLYLSAVISDEAMKRINEAIINANEKNKMMLS